VEVDHGSPLVRVSRSWEFIGQIRWVMEANWLEQVGHGSRSVGMPALEHSIFLTFSC